MKKSWCPRSRAAAAMVATGPRNVSKISPATLPETHPTLAHHSIRSRSDGDGCSSSNGGVDFVFKRLAMLPPAHPLDDHLNRDLVSCVMAAGDCIYTASENEICIWSRNLQSTPSEFVSVGRIAVKSPVKTLVISGNRIFSGHKDNKVRVWERVYPRKQDMNYKLVTTLPRMRQLVVSSLWADNYVQVRRHHKKLWLQHADTVSALVVSETRGLLYSASWDKTVKVWRLSDLKCIESIKSHHDAVNALLLVNNNNNNNISEWLYTASSDGSVKVWMQQRGQRQHKHKLLGSIEGGHANSASVNAIAFTDLPASLLWSAGSDGAILGWGLKNNKLSDVAEYELRAANMACGGGSILSLRANGDLLFSVSSLERAVRVWRVTDRTNVKAASIVNGRRRRSPYDYELYCLGVLDGGHGACVRSICVSDCGRLLYSGGADRVVHAWLLAEERKHSSKS